MNTDDKKIVIDAIEVSMRLRFLVDKLVMMKSPDRSVNVTKVVSFTVDNHKKDGSEGIMVSLYTGLGIKRIDSLMEFADIIVQDESGRMVSLYDICSNEGIFI